MPATKARPRSAETLRKHPKKTGLLESNHKIFGSNSFIYPSKIRSRSARGYDLYGNIALVDAVPSVAKKMARNLMLVNKNVKTVLRKGGAVKGRYRTRKLYHVLGAKNYIATYKENGCTFRFDMRKTFFSNRLSYERNRINKLVKDGERIIVMFAGIGPYAVEIAKQHKKCSVIAIELNGEACRYMVENIRLNKTGNVTAEHGDVRRFADKYANFADRIIMPLPTGALAFLPVALKMCKKGCTIHYYAFCPIGKIEEAMDEAKSLITSEGKKVRASGRRIVRSYSRDEVEMVADFQIH